MAFVVSDEYQSVVQIGIFRERCQPLFQQSLVEQLAFKPNVHRTAETVEPSRCGSHGGADQSMKLLQWLLVKTDEVDTLQVDSGTLQTEFDRSFRKLRIMLDPAEAFLLSCRNNSPVFDQRRSAIVIE